MFINRANDEILVTENSAESIAEVFCSILLILLVFAILVGVRHIYRNKTEQD